MADNDLPVRREEIVPNPDPTSRTLESIEQRTAELQRLLDIRFQSEAEARLALKETFAVRIDAIEKAQVTFSHGITSVPTDVDKRVGGLKELHERQFGERFASIQQQIEGILRQIDEGNQGIQRQLEGMQKQSEQTSIAAKDAVNTAFLASKEAVAAAFSAARELGIAQNTFVAAANEKTEKNVNLLLDRLTDLVKTTNSGLEQQINNLKERFAAGEGRGSGYSQSWLILLGALGMVGTLLAIYAAIKP